MRSPQRAATLPLVPVPTTSPKTDTPSRFKSLFRAKSNLQLASINTDASPPLVAPTFPETAPPPSPTILLSPSTPEFPEVSLPNVVCDDSAVPARQADEHADVQELILNPQPDVIGRDEQGAQSQVQSTGTKTDKKLRHSLMLLDTRLAELESIGAAGQTSPNPANPLPVVREPVEEEVEHLASGDYAAVNYMLSGRSFFSQPTKRDPSMQSLASVASGTSTHSSSEDAFDIVDFPSIDQLTINANYDLQQAPPSQGPQGQPSPRNRSSDLMAFPIPPSDVPLIPLHSDSFTSDAIESANVTQEEERVFAQLASLGQGDEMQGLGLFSSTSTSRPSSRLTDADNRSLCSNTSSSFEASTLASSCAPTLGFGRSTTSFKTPGEDVPSTPSLYSRRAATAPLPMMPPPPVMASYASATPAPSAVLGSPFSLHQEFPPSPGSLSPHSYSDSPIMPPPSPTRSFSTPSIRLSTLPPPQTMSPVSDGSASPGLSRPSSRSELGFAEMHQASVGLLGLFDDGGIPMWQVRPEDEYSRNGSGAEDEQEELLDEASDLKKSYRSTSRVDRPSPLRSFSSSSSLNASPSSTNQSPMGALRRLSSFQILKKRKSEVVLGSTPIVSPRPALNKPKSEMALSTLAKRQAKAREQEADKENAQPTVPPSASSNRLARLSLRSASSPRLSKLATCAPKLDPPTPASPAPTTMAKPSSRPSGFSARPRALSFNKSGEEGNASTSSKKRFSIFIPKQFSSPRDESVPPVPPTPTEHLPAATEARAKGATVVVDVAKEDVSDAPKPRKAPSPRVAARPAPLNTTPAIPALGDSDSPTPSSAGFPITPTSSAFSEALPPLSGVRTEDAAPPTSSPALDGPFGPLSDDPITLATFLRSDTPEQIVNRPKRGDSITAASSATPKQFGKGEDRPTSPLGDRTNWSRPTSPALLDALKTSSPFPYGDLIVVPQQVTVFPVRLPPPPPGAVAVAAAEDEDADEGEDDYGEDSDSDEDKPLGVVVPGALTAQKSLRKTISKKSRGDKKVKATAPKRPKEDPFELEAAAAMVATPSTSMDGHSAPSSVATPRAGAQAKVTRPAPSFEENPLSASAIRASQAVGHDSFLPQTDASIARKASSNGMRRSPSTPLDPMIANSALTIDSPVLTQEPLPMQHATLPSSNVFPSRSLSGSKKRSDLQIRTSHATSPPPGVQVPLRSPPLHGPPTVGPPRSRPPPVPSASYDSSAPSSRRTSATDGSVPPPLNRRPSLHPDVAHTQASYAMKRQPSSSSSKSSSTSHSALPSPSLAARPSVGGRSRSGTMPSAGPAVDRRVYINKVGGADAIVVKVSDRTVAGEIVAYAKGKGVLNAGRENEGGWALWEVWTSMGLERPIREYELVNDVLKTFEGDSAAFVLRRAALWPVLSSHARLHPATTKNGAVQLELKKGKWSKRFLELKDGTLSYSKSEKGKDATTLCQLAGFSAFYVDAPSADRLKAPKPHVLALKSRLTRAHFEEVSQYCNFVSFKTAEEREGWMTSITEAGNAQLRQREQAVLGVSSQPAMPTSPLLSNTPPVPSAPFSLATSGASSSPFTSPTSAAPTSTASSRNVLVRNPSSRPAPAILSAPPATLGGVPASTQPAMEPSLSRQGTVSKPDARQWGSMSEQDRQVWLKHSEKKAKDTKVPLVDLSR
ncbi:hypothetical protein JCM10212_003436 [Sporobolomyces blumeae]